MTPDAKNRHLSCSPLVVDELAWDELAALLATTLDEVWEIQDRSLTRQAE
jgi:hypothetical protein